MKFATKYIKAFRKGQLAKFRKNQPWDHFVLDGIVSRFEFKDLQKRVFGGVDDHSPRRFIPDKQLTSFLTSDKFKVFVRKLAGFDIELSPDSSIELGRVTEQSPETPSTTRDPKQKSLVMMYYIAPGWKPDCGGELVLQECQKSIPHDGKWIAPVENRMVLFFTEPGFWHRMRKVRGWEKFVVMAEWLVCAPRDRY